MTNDWKTIALWTAIGFVLGALVIYGIGTNTTWFDGNDDTDTTTQTGTNTGTSTNTGGTNTGTTGTNTNTSPTTGGTSGAGTLEGLETLNQKAGMNVVVPRAVFAAPGWVVVHELNANGSMGNALGAAWKPAGTHQNTNVSLLRGTVAGRDYLVVLHADDGDKRFETKSDLPLKTAAGEVVMRRFSAQQ